VSHKSTEIITRAALQEGDAIEHETMRHQTLLGGSGEDGKEVVLVDRRAQALDVDGGVGLRCNDD
jgi:hypothetical protein